MVKKNKKNVNTEFTFTTTTLYQYSIGIYIMHIAILGNYTGSVHLEGLEYLGMIMLRSLQIFVSYFLLSSLNIFFTSSPPQSRVLATIGVTRGFGDHDLKAQCSSLPIKPFLTPEPEVGNIFRLFPSSFFMLICYPPFPRLQHR